MSESVKLRIKGNEIYLRITEMLCPNLKEKRLKEVLICYDKACTTAVNHLELCAASKNRSVVVAKLSRFYANEKANENLCDFYFGIFIESIHDAITFGQDCEQNEWIHNLQVKSLNCLGNYDRYLKTFPYTNRIDRLQKFVVKNLTNELKFSIFYLLFKYNYEYSIQLQDGKQIRLAIKIVNECNQYYEECKTLYKHNSHLLEQFIGFIDDSYFDCNDLLTDMYDNYQTQIAVLNGLNSKLIAQELFHKYCMDEETLNFEMCYQIVDWYKDSIIKTRDRDIEAEAEVSSDLAYMFDVIFKRPEKAAEYYKHCWHLCDSLKPKVFTKYGWFMRCSRAIIKYQQRVYEMEQEELKKEKDKVMHEIKKDLDDITRIGTEDQYKFLEYVYKNYPLKNKNHILATPLNADNISKALKDAIIHYHPDRNSSKDYGHAWYFIVECITQNLTRFYEKMKSTK